MNARLRDLEAAALLSVQYIRLPINVLCASAQVFIVLANPQSWMDLPTPFAAMSH